MAFILALVVPQPANWFAGWALVLAAFLTGAIVGLRFHDDAFLGGYASFRRRMVRLGHIALAALGIMNVLFALSPLPGGAMITWASRLFIAGAVLMPAVCFASAWKQPARHLFFLPVCALVAAVLLTLFGASS